MVSAPLVRVVPHPYRERAPQGIEAMRAEVENIVEEIKQSLGLLRRSL